MPPTTDINVAMKAKFAQSNDLEIAIGIKSTSVGIGKKIDSIKLTKHNRPFDWNVIILRTISLYTMPYPQA